MMLPGLRVVRGPDWCHGDGDGGIGYLGTVVKILSNNTVGVQWDIGTETVCRAGLHGAYDLRIYDNAQIGIVCSKNIVLISLKLLFNLISICM